jgi:hypothetical protein
VSPKSVEGVGQNALHRVLAKLIDQAVPRGIGLKNVNGFVQIVDTRGIKLGPRPGAQLKDRE